MFQVACFYTLQQGLYHKCLPFVCAYILQQCYAIQMSSIFACVCVFNSASVTKFFSLPPYIFYIDNDPPDQNFSTAHIF